MEIGHIRVRVAAAIVDGDRILLVPHRRENGSTVWYLPGGGVEFCEGLPTGLIRELQEETGLLIRPAHLFGVAESIILDEPWHSVTVIYRADIVGGELKAEHHAKFGELMPGWYKKEQLPEIVPYLRQYVEKALAVEALRK